MKQLEKDFPILSREDARGHRLVYLDNAATTQKPFVVLNAEAKYYQSSNANPHRGAYDLSIAASQLLESVRSKTKKWLHASSRGEVIFTKNATEALNLVALSYGMSFLGEGDEIVVSIAEHHSNLVPWQVVAKSRKAKLSYLYTDKNGMISEDEIRRRITKRTKLVAVSHVSNVTGCIHPIEKIIEYAHRMGAVVVVDGTQGLPHLIVDVESLDADFYVFSAHKMLAPMGTGVLYAKKSLLEQMPPFLYGGDMIEYVEEQSATYAPIPQKFEAGTHNLGSIAGFGAALDYLERIGMDNLRGMEESLTGYLIDRLCQVPHLKLVGPKELKNRIGVAAFLIEDIHPHDIATIVNYDSVAIRSGHHCAQPLHRYLELPATCRASVYLYNTTQDIDRLYDSLLGVRRRLGYGAG